MSVLNVSELQQFSCCVGLLGMLSLKIVANWYVIK